MTRVAEVLKFRDQGLSVEDARKAMLADRQAPVVPAPVVPAPEIAAPVVEGEDFEDEVPVLPAVINADAVQTPVVPVAAAVTSTPATPGSFMPERVENDQFIGEILQEGGKWVARLTYKKGGGVERFEAGTRTGLMVQLLQGKGHATMRVKEAVRRERFGSPDVDVAYPLPEGITAETFGKLPEDQQHAMLFTVASQQAIAFRDKHPEFPRSEANTTRVNKFLSSHKPQLPITVRNLEYAFACLTDAEELEVPASEKVSATPVPATQQTDSAAPAAPAPPAPAAAPAAPAVTVRKRGTTGLQPEHSSSPVEPERAEAAAAGPRQLSEAELRKLPLPELKRISDADRRARGGVLR